MTELVRKYHLLFSILFVNLSRTATVQNAVLKLQVGILNN